MKTNFFFGLFCLTVIASCSSPDQKINVQTSQKQLPVLTNKDANEVLKITVIKLGSAPVTIKKINISTIGTTDLKDVKSISIFYTGDNNRFSSENIFSESDLPADKLALQGEQKIEQDTAYFWVSYKLNDKANLLNSVDASCISLNTNYGIVNPTADSTAASITQQLGVAVRQHMQDSVHTYRIPGLTTTSKGTLLASYDVRRDLRRDLQGDLDIGISRSTDGGQTWEPMRIALDMGTWGDLPEKFNGVSDACLLADTNSGDVYVAGLWMYGVINKEGKWVEGLTEESEDWNHQWKNKGSQPGFGVKETSQFMIAKSEDDGITWSEPVNITRMGKKEEWWLYAPGPGHGMVMENGTLIFPTQGRNKMGESFSNITYSTDHGKTWKSSNAAYSNTTESMVVQLDDGSLMLNMRNNRNRKNKSNTNGRAIAVTSDMGDTWEEHATSQGALIEPTCMASLHKHVYQEGGEKKSILLFSNPNSKFRRKHMTIKVSFDNGETWPEEKWILLDEAKLRGGYSCLTSIDENNIGILYESSQADMTFQKISLNKLIKK